LGKNPGPKAFAVQHVGSLTSTQCWNASGLIAPALLLYGAKQASLSRYFFQSASHCFVLASALAIAGRRAERGFVGFALFAGNDSAAVLSLTALAAAS